MTGRWTGVVLGGQPGAVLSQLMGRELADPGAFPARILLGGTNPTFQAPIPPGQRAGPAARISSPATANLQVNAPYPRETMIVVKGRSGNWAMSPVTWLIRLLPMAERTAMPAADEMDPLSAMAGYRVISADLAIGPSVSFLALL
jgi:hypothetical protein